MERGAFLARVRQHLGAASTVALPESWPDTPASGRSADVETFQASLALALALADQVRSLSVTDRARLDSLFLDEGFGTLDQETLGVVVAAIEQLAGDGRLVGVITHVRDLAEQFPRIEVEKSHRGSSLQLVP